MKPLEVEIIRIPGDDEALLQQAFDIRNKVFVEELGIDPALEYDRYEKESHYYLVKHENQPIGTARWRKTEKGIKIERCAILPGFRDRGAGEVLVRQILEDVVPMGLKIYLHAQLKAAEFYERMGFKQVSDVFFEARIGHYCMEYSG
jgi:predicted GNAT family N-acyltransferase